MFNRKYIFKLDQFPIAILVCRSVCAKKVGTFDFWTDSWQFGCFWFLHWCFEDSPQAGIVLYVLYWKKMEKLPCDTAIHSLCLGIVVITTLIWVVVLNMFYVHPYLGKIPILTNIFQMGWNHQPVMIHVVFDVLLIHRFLPGRCGCLGAGELRFHGGLWDGAAGPLLGEKNSHRQNRFETTSYRQPTYLATFKAGYITSLECSETIPIWYLGWWIETFDVFHPDPWENAPTLTSIFFKWMAQPPTRQ